MPDQEIVEVETPEVVPEVEEQTETAAVPEAATSESEEKKHGGVQRKIDKLTREKYEAQGQARELRERLASIEQRLAGQPAAAAKVESDDPKPDIKNWAGTYEELTEALSRWAARQEHKALSEKSQKERDAAEQQERQQEAVASYQERSNEFTAEHEDFNEVVGKIKLATDVAMGVQIAIMEDENGPALAYYLGQNPEICQQLSELTPQKALTQLGRISARLFPDATEAEDSPAPPTKAAAPAPIKPVKKVAPTATGLNDDDDMDTWLAKRNRQLGRK